MANILLAKDEIISKSQVDEARKEFEEFRGESREAYIFRKFPRDLTIDTLFDVSHYETIEQRLIRIEKYGGIYSALQKSEREKARPRFEIPVESSVELTLKFKQQRLEHSLKYLPNNFTPYRLEKNERKVTEEDIVVAKKREKSLIRFNPTLIYSELIYLNVVDNSRTNQNEIYKHSRKELYLKHTYGLTGESKWNDITNYYDWEQIYLNPRTPYIEFKKKI